MRSASGARASASMRQCARRGSGTAERKVSRLTPLLGAGVDTPGPHARETLNCSRPRTLRPR
eukprot:7099919-Alexandrium_andersonii.AAC.1